MSRPDLVLASGSAIRAAILKGAGLDFRVQKPAVDEDEIKREMAGEDLEEIAMALAVRKALAVPAPGALVIGSDQIMEFEGRAFDKPKSMEEACDRLLDMQGKAHTLINAVAVAKDGAIVYRRLDRPKLVMRAMTKRDIEAYLEAAGEGVLASVGAYQIESLGAHLFEQIEGDHFAVLGLSLYPLLGFLAGQGVRPF
ncbi:MAG TPA: nucleoside triphosphate pyrophosphatase [Parvularculaceae bacterium]|nr:Maf-like protein [Caulobacterales bacterium]HPE32809.1 nucleoside triphosphate pyrophosphatase [Parvularculaceae bacterium]